MYQYETMRISSEDKVGAKKSFTREFIGNMVTIKKAPRPILSILIKAIASPRTTKKTLGNTISATRISETDTKKLVNESAEYREPKNIGMKRGARQLVPITIAIDANE